MTTPAPIPRLKKMVEYMLEENPKWQNVEARNSDVALTVIIWQRWFNVSDLPDGIIHLRRLLDLPREDNIKRIRAVIQNTEHRFLPTSPEVLKKRGIEREYWEDALGYTLTTEEWATHFDTERDTKPPVTIPGFEESIARFDEIIDTVRITKMDAAYIPKNHTKDGPQQGQIYTLEVVRLVMGKPVKVVAPFPATYSSLQHFMKNWRVVT